MVSCLNIRSRIASGVQNSTTAGWLCKKACKRLVKPFFKKMAQVEWQASQILPNCLSMLPMGLVLALASASVVYLIHRQVEHFCRRTKATSLRMFRITARMLCNKSTKSKIASSRLVPNTMIPRLRKNYRLHQRLFTKVLSNSWEGSKSVRDTHNLSITNQSYLRALIRFKPCQVHLSIKSEIVRKKVVIRSHRRGIWASTRDLAYLRQSPVHCSCPSKPLSYAIKTLIIEGLTALASTLWRKLHKKATIGTICFQMILASQP